VLRTEEPEPFLAYGGGATVCNSGALALVPVKKQHERRLTKHALNRFYSLLTTIFWFGLAGVAGTAHVDTYILDKR
jgi:hypothetical protein